MQIFIKSENEKKLKREASDIIVIALISDPWADILQNLYSIALRVH